MKKLIAFTIAISLCTSMFACSDSKKEKTETLGNVVAEQLSDVAYKKEKIELPKGMFNIYMMSPYNDSANFMMLGADSEGVGLYTTDNKFSSYTRLDMPEFDYGMSYDITTASDGTVFTVVNDPDYGNLPDVDIYSPEYDAELYESVAVYRLKLNKFAADGALISSVEITDFPNDVTSTTSVTGLATDGKNSVALIGGTYYLIDENGKCKGELKLEADMFKNAVIEQIGTNREGKLLCAVQDNEADQLWICEVDTEKAVVKESKVAYTFNETVLSGIIPGTGDYEYFFSSRTSIYGISSADGSIKSIFNVMATELNPNVLDDFYVDEEGLVSVAQNSNDYTEAKFYRYLPCDPSEIENMPRITVAMFYEDYIVSDMINEWNETHDEFRVEKKIYQTDSTGDDYDIAIDKYAEDILAGEYPDIYLLQDGDFCETRPEEQGVLCDLYELIENDPDFDRDNLYEPVTNLYETDGKLLALPNLITVDLGVVMKAKYADEVDVWNAETLMKLHRNLPENMSITEWRGNLVTKSDRFFSTWYNFIDFENKTCDYNNDTFIEFLEYCNEGEDEYVDEYAYMYDDMESEEFQEFSEAMYKKEQLAFRDDTALIAQYNNTLMSYNNYYDMTVGKFGGEDIKILGKYGGGIEISPLSGEFAICEKSDNKELAWQFIKSQMSDEFYEENCCDANGVGVGGFPITDSGLEIAAAKQLQPCDNKWYEKNPEYTGLLYNVGLGVEDIEIGSPDQSTIDEVNNILNTYKLERNGRMMWDEDLQAIIDEETERFFNGGCSAKECAEAFQSRISIYLAEHE